MSHSNILHPKVLNVDSQINEQENKQEHARYNLIKLAWSVILLGIILFIFWAMLAPLDKGVVLDAVVVEGKRKLLQHSDGGSINDVLIKNGDWVEKDQVMILLDQGSLTAARDTALVRYLALFARNERLKNEADLEKKSQQNIDFDHKLISLIDHYPQYEYILSQEQALFLQRKEKQGAEKTLLIQKKESELNQAKGWQAVSLVHKKRIALFKRRISDLESLNLAGYSARHDVDNLSIQLAEVVAENETAKVRSVSFSESADNTAIQLQQQLAAEAESIIQQLVDSSVQLIESKQQFLETQLKLERTIIRAPVDGQVVGLNMLTSGQVIRAAEDILEIVPRSQKLHVEGRVPVDLIDSLAVGMEVDLLFTAFNLSETPKVKGRVATVASDRQVDERTGEPYYQMGIEVLKSNPLLDNLALQPGMPVQAFIRNGSRSMVSYLLKPVFDRIPQAMASD